MLRYSIIKRTSLILHNRSDIRQDHRSIYDIPKDRFSSSDLGHVASKNLRILFEAKRDIRWYQRSIPRGELFYLRHLETSSFSQQTVSLTGSREYQLIAQKQHFLIQLFHLQRQFSPNRRHMTPQAYRIFLKPARPSTTSMLLTLPKELKLLMLVPPRSLTVHSISHCIPVKRCSIPSFAQFDETIVSQQIRDTLWLQSESQENHDRWYREQVSLRRSLSNQKGPSIAIPTTSKLNRNSS